MTNTTADLVAALERAEAELLECAEYFDQRADADGDSEGFNPNREMVMHQSVSEALERIDAALARAKGAGEVSDERIAAAMHKMAERHAEREEEGFWRDRAKAHIADMRARPIDDPQVQEAIAEVRLFLTALQEPGQ